MSHWSYIHGDYYFTKKEIMMMIEITDMERRIRRADEQQVCRTSEVYLITTFMEDLIERINNAIE
tara:strand:+ start:210 stop:404 length:195 start_codon:yes stop_codon:yes gene_type:complete